jgi:hypothetical protein
MSAQRIELVASATQTGSGNSATFSVNTATMASLGIDVTAENMTDFDAWLEGSDDGGTTWYPVAPDSITIGSTRVVTRVPTASDAVVSHAAGAETFAAEYKHLPWDRVRLAWALTGTDITFSASLVVK